jgi:shikimate dehydrogenase
LISGYNWHLSQILVILRTRTTLEISFAKPIATFPNNCRGRIAAQPRVFRIGWWVLRAAITNDFRLGLIGTGIGRSLTPFLQEATGSQFGLDLRYELFDTPADQFDLIEAKLEQLKQAGYAGVNVTHPFKELAFDLVEVGDPMVRRIGAINTVRFEDMQGFNTDYSGFIRAYRHVRSSHAPGSVLVVGAGGAGKAVAFALVTLGASQLRITDTDFAKAEQLAHALNLSGGNASAHPISDFERITDVAGLVNCTPLGMYQYPGNPIPNALVNFQEWVFDAIYTPLETEFLANARARGLAVIRGSELMFYQALDAFEIWTGHKPTESALYAILQEKLRTRDSNA